VEKGIFASKAVGTFTLVFVGTGAIMVNDISGGALGHVGTGPTCKIIQGTNCYRQREAACGEN
jgi:hypothetical protein